MSDISLNAGIRSNLLQLQQSSRLFDRTTERLASGREVNSAIDNPTNFFASVNLNDRASGLETRLDSMGQAIQRIKAADNGISTIRGFVSAMKGVVNNALGNTDADARADLGSQFNELIVQISETAKDSGYAGINLLERNETETVQFNETFDASVLNVRGFDVRGPGSDGRGRVDASGNVASAAITANITQASQASVASVSSVASASAQASVASVSASGFSATVATANTVSFAGGTGYTATGAAANTVAIGTASSASQASQASQASVASVASQAATATSAVAIALDTQRDDAVGIQGAGSGAGMVDWGGAGYKDDLAAVIQQLETFDEALQTQASDLAQNLATITTREDFSNELINTLTEGADELTLADLNEEGANLLALQTSQQLATQSLSLASQQSQQVLQLLG